VQKNREKKKRDMSSSSGYVAIPRCPVIFDGANHPDFAAFMRVHMRGLCLWGALSSEVSCPPCPTPPVAAIPSTLVVLGMVLLRRPRMLLRVPMIVLLLPMS
jgi:hypothetical protein